MNGRHVARVADERSQIVDIITVWLGGLVALATALAGISQLTDLHPAVSLALTCVGTGGGAVLMYLRGLAQEETVPTANVLEARSGDVVVAGPANEKVLEGSEVRRWEGPGPLA